MINGTRDCRHCLHVGEDIASGTNELFCAHPKIPLEPNQLELDLRVANICDFYEQDENPGLYFHDVPLLSSTDT
jgi:hypothetical protein